MCPCSYGICDECNRESNQVENNALYQILERAKENGVKVEVEK